MGAALFAVLVAIAVVFAERLAVWQLASVPVILTALLLMVLVTALVHHERHTEHPLVHPALLGNRLVAGANVATLGASIGMVGLLYFFNLFAQSAVGFDSNAIGVLAALVPFGLSLIVCAQFARWLRIRVGPRWPAVLGLGLMTVGLRVARHDHGSDVEDPAAGAVGDHGTRRRRGQRVADRRRGARPARRPGQRGRGLDQLVAILGSALAIVVGTTTYLSIGGPDPPPARRGRVGFHHVRRRRRHASTTISSPR